MPCPIGFTNATVSKDTVATVAAGVAAVGSVFGLYVYISKRKQRFTRRATLQCQCGKVQAEIYQPAANYKYMETACIQCGCSSCVGYVEAVLKEASDKMTTAEKESISKAFFDPGVPTVLLYDSEIEVIEGKELLEHVKITPKTENRRVFAKCCATPLAICPDHSHLNLVYCPIIKPIADWHVNWEKEIPFPQEVLDHPTVCFHGAKFLTEQNGTATTDEEIQTKHPNLQIIPVHNAPLFMLGMVTRLVLLMGIGARGPGHGFPVDADKQVGIGLESISKQMK